MKICRRVYLILICAVILFNTAISATYIDYSHRSKVLKKEKHYRVLFPDSYDKNPDKRYPVLYWFHGHGGSYKQTTYLKPFQAYLKNHDMLIVMVDGANGDKTWYDYSIAYENGSYEGVPVKPDLLYHKYFRELVANVDSRLRTIAGRDHRATSGQSRGGYMAPWIASQNKDLVAIVTAFSPSPDAAMQGPKELVKKTHFPNHQLYRALKGLAIRYTGCRGDRYVQYYWEQKALWELMDLDYHYHNADCNTHQAWDIPRQFDWIMKEFTKKHPQPKNWNHASPYFNTQAWGYRIKAKGKTGALTCLEKVSPLGMLVGGRTYVFDGPYHQEEKLNIVTDAIYKPGTKYTLIDYNRSSGEFFKKNIKSDKKGRLEIELKGGGHALGVSGEKEGAKLFMLPANNREEIFIEAGRDTCIDFTLVNVGAEASGPVTVKLITPRPFLDLKTKEIKLNTIKSGEKCEVKGKIKFRVQKYDMTDLYSDGWVTKIAAEYSYGDKKGNTDFLIFTAPKTEYARAEDVLILDGSKQTFPVYKNQHQLIYRKTVKDGKGNGNEILDPGEEVLIYVRTPKGLGEKDISTFHSAYLMNPDQLKHISSRTKFIAREDEMNWSGAAGSASYIIADKKSSKGKTLDLLLRLEIYDFKRIKEGDDVLQWHGNDFRRVRLKIGG